MKTEAIPMEQLFQLLTVQLEKGDAPLRVTGCSMHPTLRSGLDTVYLRKPQADLRKGDVILYQRQNGQYVLHRIVRTRGEDFICSGDNQFEPEHVSAQQVIARVTSFRRGAKEYAVSHIGYRAYVWFWVGIFPARKPFIRLRRLFGRLRGNVRKLRKIFRRNER